MTKKRSTEQGIAVLFFETDLQKTSVQKEESYTPQQKRIFHSLSETVQEKIRTGYGTVIADLGNDERICEFNTEDHHFPEGSVERLARSLFPHIQEFYSKEENRRAFEEHMKKQNNK